MKKSGKILIVVLCLIILGLATFIVVDKLILTKKYDKSINEESNTIIADNRNKSEGNTLLKEDNNNNSANNEAKVNVVKKEQKDEANEAIRKLLKDENLLLKKFMNIVDETPGFAWVDEHDGDENYEPELNFAKLNSINGSPAYVVEYESQLILVTYKDGKVITSDDLIVGAQMDIDKGIILSEGYQGVVFEINEYGIVNILENKIDDDGIDLYYYKGKTCTKEEYYKYKSEYEKKYNFTTIHTKLTNENIDKYVK